METLTERVPHRRATIALIHVGFIVTGVVTTLLGPILPILIARWSLTDTRAGLFFALQFCGNLVGIASLRPLLSWRGYRLTFFLGFIFMSLGTATLLPVSQTVGMISTALYGFGLGLILSGTNLWIAEIAALRRATALNVLNLAWGVGAITCPVLVTFAQRGNRLLALLLGIAAFSAFAAVALAASDIEPRVGDSDISAEQHQQPRNKTATIALGGLFFLYVGTEASVSGWTASLAKRVVAMPGTLWALAPLFFWAGLLTGRALAPVVLAQVSEGTLLMSGLILAAVGTGTLLLVTTFGGVAICVTVSGLGLACIYPLLVARMVGYYGKRARRIGSAMFALAALGGATMPWFVGFRATQTGSLRIGLLVPLVGCLVMMSLWLVLRRGTVS